MGTFLIQHRLYVGEAGILVLFFTDEKYNYNTLNNSPFPLSNTSSFTLPCVDGSQEQSQVHDSLRGLMGQADGTPYHKERRQSKSSKQEATQGTVHRKSGTGSQEPYPSTVTQDELKSHSKKL
jgi:hypothetical protein